MTEDVSRYEVDIDLGDLNVSHTQVVDLVGSDKRVLDLGCWTGDLGRALTGRGCRVSGLEVDPVAAEKAREHLDEVVVADLDTVRLGDHFEAASFDAVIFADVLEHLRDPAANLRDAATLLAPGGQVVISIPNVTHGSLRLALLQGNWNYTETGLLDSTHIQFFSRARLLDLFAQAGYLIDVLQATTADPLAVEVVVNASRIPPAVVEWVRDQPDALAYQFVLAAHPADDGEEQDPAGLQLHTLVPDEAVRVSDRHTDHARRELDERHRLLTVRDHIIGLEAAAASAQMRAERAEQKLDGAIQRLERKNDRIRKQAKEIEKLASEAVGNTSPLDGLRSLRRLGRAKSE